MCMGGNPWTFLTSMFLSLKSIKTYSQVRIEKQIVLERINGDTIVILRTEEKFSFHTLVRYLSLFLPQGPLANITSSLHMRPRSLSPEDERSEGCGLRAYTSNSWGYAFWLHDGGSHEDSGCDDSDLPECKTNCLSGVITSLP